MAEMIDVYNENKERTGIVVERANNFLKEGQYQLYGLAVVVNSDGKYLITQRAADKAWGAGWWEVSGGGVSAGEEGCEAICREVEEETGLSVEGHTPQLIDSYKSINLEKGHNYITDIYRFDLDFSPEDIHLQESEAVDFRLVTFDEITALHEQGIFLHYERLKHALGL